jgi:ABC-type sugar transport system substrate-binding protein
MRYRYKATLAMLLAVVVVGGATACSSSSHQGNSKAVIEGQTGALAAAAAAAAKKDARPQTKLPNETLGYLQFSNTAETARRHEAGAKEAAGVLGWKFVECDGQGDLGKIAACGLTLLNEHASVIVSNNTQPSIINAALVEAKAKGVPWFIQGNVPASPLVQGNYPATNDMSMAAAIDSYFFSQLGSSGTKEIAVMDVDPSLKAVGTRLTQFQADLKAHPNVKVVATHNIDDTNAIQGDQAAIRSIMTAHPKLAGIYSLQDVTVVAIGQEVASMGFTGSKKPLIVGYFGDLPILDSIRKGQIDATVDGPVEADGWVCVDQAVESLAYKTPPATSAATLPYSLKFLVPPAVPTVVTKQNVPKTPNTYVPEAGDFVTYFKTLWTTEFNLGKS